MEFLVEAWKSWAFWDSHGTGFYPKFILVFADLVNIFCELSDLAKPISIDAIVGIHTVCIWRNLIRIIDCLCVLYRYCTKISAINS